MVLSLIVGVVLNRYWANGREAVPLKAPATAFSLQDTGKRPSVAADRARRAGGAPRGGPVDETAGWIDEHLVAVIAQIGGRENNRGRCRWRR